MNKRIIPNYLLAWVIGCLAPVAFGQGANSCLEPAYSTPEKPTQVDQQSLRRKGQLLSRDLNIALMTGDLLAMEAKFNQLDGFLSACKNYESAQGNERVRREALYLAACDADCHTILGQYKLMMAADTPFISETLKGDVSPVQAAEHARIGVEIMDRGLKVLARQLEVPPEVAQDAKPVGSDVKAETTSAKPSLFSYTFKQAKMLELKARLLMASGDMWYYTASDQRMIQLSYEIADSLKVVGQGGTDPAKLGTSENMRNALASYKMALWTIVEAKTDIPDQLVYATLTNDLIAVQKDLENRMNSAEKGFLFLNIDPEEVNLLSYDAIRNQLREMVSEIDTVESQIKNVITAGFESKLADELRKSANDDQLQAARENNARYQNGAQLSLSLHKIAQLENQAANFRENIQSKITQLDGDKESGNYRRQINGLKFQLEKQTLETNYKLENLNAKKEQDMLAYQTNKKRELLNEIRWLMNYRLSVSNLEVQILSFQAQIGEYNRNKLKNDDERKALKKSQDIKVQQKGSVEAQKAQIKTDKTELLRQKETDYRLRRDDILIQLCSMHNQMLMNGATFLPSAITAVQGDPTCTLYPKESQTLKQINDQICTIRTQLGENQQLQLATVTECLLGQPHKAGAPAPDCSGITESQRSLVKKLHEENARRALEMKTALDNLKNQTQGIIDGWLTTLQTTQRTIVHLRTAVAITGNILSLFSAMPRWMGAIAGPMGGVVTVNDTHKAVETNNTFAVKAYEHGMSSLATEFEIGRFKNELELRVKDLEDKVNAATSAITVEDLQNQLTLAKLTVEERTGNLKADAAALEATLLTYSCTNTEQVNFDLKIDALKAQYESTRKRLELLANEQTTVQSRIDDLDQQDKQQDAQLNIIKLEGEILQSNIGALDADDREIDKLIQNVDARVKNTKAVKDEIARQKTDGDNLVQEISKMTDEQFKLTLDINQDEAVFLKAQLAKEDEQFVAEKQALEEQLKIVGEQSDLNGKILANYNAIQETIKTERAKVLSLGETAANDAGRLPTSDPAAAYVANREEMFKVVNGLPDYIASKKRNLDIANRLAFLAHKKKALFSNLGGVPYTNDYTYMRSATNLKSFLSSNGIMESLKSNQIKLDSFTVHIPAGSAFSQKFARDGVVDFQISPSAADRMAEMGYLAMWPQDIDNANKIGDTQSVRLVDLIVVANYQCGVQSGLNQNNIMVEHLGSGYVFKEADASSQILMPSLENMAAQAWEDLVYDVSEADQPGDAAVARKRLLTDGHYTVGAFDADIAHAAGRSKLPFLGYPVISNYRLTARPSDCSRAQLNQYTRVREGVTMSLIFVIARPSIR